MKQIILKEEQEIEDIYGNIYKIEKGDILLESQFYNSSTIEKVFYDYIWNNILYDLQGTDIAISYSVNRLFDPKYLKEVALELYLDYSHKDKVNHGHIDKIYDIEDIIYPYIEEEKKNKNSLFYKLVMQPLKQAGY